jgi:hypothetical protein
LSTAHSDVFDTPITSQAQLVSCLLFLTLPGWEYRPSYLPDSLAIHIGDTGVEEPMWFYLGFMRRANREEQFIEHLIGIKRSIKIGVYELNE